MPPRRRLAILAEGSFDAHRAKTALGVLRYGRDDVVAVIDSTHAGQSVGDVLPNWNGRGEVPIVASLDGAMALPDPPDALLIGIAPTAGALPASWRSTILNATRSGLDVLSGLHTMLGDDPEFAASAAKSGAQIVDFRRPPDRMQTTLGRRHGPDKRIILTVGTDCAVGKMSASLELVRAARELGVSAAFVPTGQTGIMIDGWGVAVDRVISDFLQGTVEWLVEQGEAMGDYVVVEGQGSLDHPAYSSVTLGLIHGSTPHAMVMVHKLGIDAHEFDHLPDARYPIADLPAFIKLHETVAALVAPSRVVAVAVNSSLVPDDAEARRAIEAIAAETGLPTDDPVRFGGKDLWGKVQRAVDELPSPARAG